MIGNWSKQESQLAQLTRQAQRYVTTFRWLWMLNLAAAIIGAATRHYEVMYVAAGSSFIALIGVVHARCGQTTVSEATAESQRMQRKLDPLR